MEGMTALSLKNMSFRNRLLLFALVLILIVAIPATYQLGKRPWNMLEAKVTQGHMLLGTLTVPFALSDMSRMNQFALDMIGVVPERIGTVAADRQSDSYYPMAAPGQAFNLYITQEQIIDEQTMLKLFEENELVYTSFSYTTFVDWYHFWAQEFEKRPGLHEIFAQYKQQLIQATEQAEEQGYIIADLYIMLDRGQQEAGFFKENIAFLLEGLAWWESAYPGQEYNLVESDSLYWRNSYDRSQGGAPGYHSAQVSDPDNWYLPQFDVDDWGTWFTLWYTREYNVGEKESLYNIFSIDIDASTVQQDMWRVMSILLLMMAGMATLIFLLARIVSTRMTRPILALTAGAEAVMRRDPSHTVPRIGSREFIQLIDAFNQMAQWVREMDNLKESLSKLLSDEMAETAAKEGLVLGGQSVDCSIIFTDFAAFSTLSQKVKAEDVVYLLNRYFGELIPIIKSRNGFPDKYIGDAIVAMFGAPVHFDNHAEQAVRAAIEMQRRMRVLNEEIRQEHGIIFEMRIGINSGDVIVGAIGCDMKLEYTSIGDTTNLANRMESKCPIGHLMITEYTYEKIKGCEFENVQFNKYGDGVKVKGYNEPITAYEVIIDRLEITTAKNCDDPRNYYVYQHRDTTS